MHAGGRGTAAPLMRMLASQLDFNSILEGDKVMIVKSTYDACSEAYIVEKTVEVVAQIGEENETIRIEALRDLRDGHYSARAYRREHVTVQPTYPQTGAKYDRSPEVFQVWVDYDLPWVHREDADGALSQALGFLSQRCKKLKVAS